MQDWDIQFQWPDTPNCRFAHKLLYALIVQGVRYNTGDYPGQYRIVPINPNEEIAQEAASEEECTERLVDIVDIYTDFDQTTTGMRINLVYTDTPKPIHFALDIQPTNDSGVRVRLSVVGKEIQTQDRFQSFTDLCSGVFRRVGFPYGSFRGEYDDWIPTTADAFLQERFRRGTFLCEELGDEFGRPNLLSAPSERPVELADGRLLLVATP